MTTLAELKKEFEKKFPQDLDIWVYLQPGVNGSTTTRGTMEDVWNFVVKAYETGKKEENKRFKKRLPILIIKAQMEAMREVTKN